MNRTANAFLPFLAGLLFGTGLLASGMTNPAKVKGFLDVFGAWDPSLAFVMVGAIGVAFFAFRIAARRRVSASGMPFVLPPTQGIDTRLVAGGLIFGAGWGWAGYCPGPAIVAAGALSADAWVFVAAMLVGMALHDRFLAAGEAAA